MTFHLSAVPVLFAALAAVGYAQTPPAPPSGGAGTVIRTETRVVLVDAAVVDKKNKFIRDLTQKDFHIREDGKEQKITSFSLESASLSPERATKHYIVLFFDTTSLTPSTLLAVRQDALRFVDGFASPDRNIAVISYGESMQVLQNFTADPAKVKDALNRLQNFSTNTAAAAPAGRGGRGTPANTGVVDPSLFRRMLASLRTVADSVSTIRGRKALVLFSGGVNTTADITADINATVDSCNRANVGIYGVIGHGLVGRLNSPGGIGRALQRAAASLVEVIDPEPTGADTVFGFQRGGRGGASAPVDASGAPMNPSSFGNPSQDVVRALASGTGGLMLGSSNNLPEELGRVAQEQDEYYLIGYTPAIESPEGTCHTLLVKVDRSGLDVRARKGYCTSKPAPLVSEKPAGADLEKRTESGVANNIALRLQVPWFYAGPNTARVTVVMDIRPASMQFTKDQGKLHGEFDLLGVAYKSDGSVGARLSDTVKLDFDSQQLAQEFLKKPYRYSNQFEILPGHYDFRMSVSSGEHGFGKVETPLEIEPWNGQALAMSGIALSHDAHAAPAQGGTPEELLPGRDRPLVANGMELAPTGFNQFRTDEQGYFYFEVYEPPLRQHDLSVRFRILDHGTGRQMSDSGLLKAEPFIRAGDSVIPIVMKMPAFAGWLPPGAYKLEVSVVGAAGEASVVRTADFDLI